MLSIGLFVGELWSTAFAYEGSLILPLHANSNVKYELQNAQAGIDPSDVLQVYVDNNDLCCKGKSPIAGRYSIDERTVTFDPAFDFIEGQNYIVNIRDKGAPDEHTRYLNEFTIRHDTNVATPEVIAIFPSGTNIPENTLRFYIHFATPMKPHFSAAYIRLLDAMGTPDTAAFMSFKQELWSEDRKRLTLLMDPGRIKRGVAQNLLLGPALLEGRSYSIVVEEGWPVANGTLEMPRFEKHFTVSKALRTLPDPDRWTIKPPRISTRDPLVIEFDRSFDHELLKSGITVLDNVGRPIQGAISISTQEKTWRFSRIGEWKYSQVHIVVDTQLEDVAGNNLIELLDHSVGSEVLEQISNQKVITLALKPAPI